MRVSIDFLQARFRAPVFGARGSQRTRPLLTLSLEASDGIVGYGEAAPLESYDGVTPSEVRAALERCRELLERSDADEPHELLAACAGRAPVPQALAAIDLALWDMAGKRAGEPVWRLLGSSEPRATAINATIATEEPRAAAAQADIACKSGIVRVKIKVGAGDDLARVSAVRGVLGDAGEIRVDANGAWSTADALAALASLEPMGIELCEEPSAGVDATRRIAQRSPVAIAIDETAVIPGVLDRRICRAVSLKLSRFGGISGLLAAGRRARVAGYDLYLSSTFDGPLGIAAALHAACAMRPERACGLATLALFERPDPLAVDRAAIAPPPGPGLGDGLIDWYRLSE